MGDRRTESTDRTDEQLGGPGPEDTDDEDKQKTKRRPRGRRGTAARPPRGNETLSPLSAVSGTLTAFGLLALLAALSAGIAAVIGADIAGLSDDEWRNVGIGGAAAMALALLASFAFGGYTAGRMAGRAGLRHGLVVFGLGLLVIVVAGLVTSLTADTTAVGDELRDQGVPTSTDTWTDIGIGAGIAAALAMLVGALLGGWRGERWHARPVAHGTQPARPYDEIVADARSRDGDDRTAIDLPTDTGTEPGSSLEEERADHAVDPDERTSQDH
ncbi:MAG TPA: hypothetical protein VMN58_08850 [Acidimicrobiales bacterium]|nr:hypothetical protein [Acidimicrobiales bacterium]